MTFTTAKRCLLLFQQIVLTLFVGSTCLTLQPGDALAVKVSVAPTQSKEIVVSAINNKEYLPAVAYNSKHNEYLVVWHTTWTIGSRDIRATRISATGKILATFVVYDNPTRDSAQPSVAYDPVSDRYLVVWVYDSFGDGSDWDLYGRFVPWDGPAAGLSEFVISSLPTHQWSPRIVYAAGVKEFLVVWNNEYQAGTVPMYISGLRIKAVDGTFPFGGVLKTDLTISHTSENRINPDITYNSAQNQYLVVYDNGQDIFGTRFSATQAYSLGGEFGIAGWPGVEIKPAAASCGSADQYLVAWQSDQGTGDDAIFGRFISGQGKVGNVYMIDDSTSPEQNPDVVCNDRGTLYTVVWQIRYTNKKYGIWGRLVLPDEKMGSVFPIASPGTAADRTKPRIAAGPKNFLVTWEHERDTSYQDIHARIGTPYSFPWNMFMPPIIVPRN